MKVDDKKYLTLRRNVKLLPSEFNVEWIELVASGTGTKYKVKLV